MLPVSPFSLLTVGAPLDSVPGCVLSQALDCFYPWALQAQLPRSPSLLKPMKMQPEK